MRSFAVFKNRYTNSMTSVTAYHYCKALFDFCSVEKWYMLPTETTSNELFPD